MTYKQNWTAYNEAQATEKRLFLDVLDELCSYVPVQKKRQVGRPSAPVGEMIFCCVTKVYENLSSRRNSSDLEFARQKGYLSHTPHFNTVLRYLNDPRLTRLLTSLVQLSALPLKELESTFAVDASGLSSAFYSRWLDHRFNGDRRYHDWLKINLICGVRSNIVTHVVVIDGKASESPQFPELVKETTKNFNIKEVCADKGYSSRKNIQVAWDLGAVPYIPFKKNATIRKKGNQAWSKMFYVFHFENEEFLKRYHQRSNAETTFSMLKKKFSNRLMMKGEIGRVNEALAKVLCHNICVLIREYYRSGIVLDLKQDVNKFPGLHINHQYPLN